MPPTQKNLPYQGAQTRGPLRLNRIISETDPLQAVTTRDEDASAAYALQIVKDQHAIVHNLTCRWSHETSAMSRGQGCVCSIHSLAVHLPDEE